MLLRCGLCCLEEDQVVGSLEESSCPYQSSGPGGSLPLVAEIVERKARKVDLSASPGPRHQLLKVCQWGTESLRQEGNHVTGGRGPTLFPA